MECTLKKYASLSVAAPQHSVSELCPQFNSKIFLDQFDEPRSAHHLATSCWHFAVILLLNANCHQPAFSASTLAILGCFPIRSITAWIRG